MNQAEAKEKLAQVVTTLKPIVAKIEARPEITRNRYGDYMAILSEAPPAQRKQLAACLIMAGANENGIVSALKLTI